MWDPPRTEQVPGHGRSRHCHSPPEQMLWGDEEEEEGTGAGIPTHAAREVRVLPGAAAGGEGGPRGKGASTVSARALRQGQTAGVCDVV